MTSSAPNKNLTSSTHCLNQVSHTSSRVLIQRSSSVLLVLQQVLTLKVAGDTSSAHTKMIYHMKKKIFFFCRLQGSLQGLQCLPGSFAGSLQGLQDLQGFLGSFGRVVSWQGLHGLQVFRNESPPVNHAVEYCRSFGPVDAGIFWTSGCRIFRIFWTSASRILEFTTTVRILEFTTTVAHGVPVSFQFPTPIKSSLH